MDDKGQENLKCFTQNKISTKEGFNVKLVNSNVRLYEEGGQSRMKYGLIRI